MEIVQSRNMSVCVIVKLNVKNVTHVTYTLSFIWISPSQFLHSELFRINFIYSLGCTIFITGHVCSFIFSHLRKWILKVRIIIRSGGWYIMIKLTRTLNSMIWNINCCIIRVFFIAEIFLAHLISQLVKMFS